MDLKGIISISGKSGLFKVVAQGKNNVIVESLEDNKRFPAYTKDKISSLEDISIYTYDEDMPLKDVFQKLYELEEGKISISHKEDKSKLDKHLDKILPNLNKEKVYTSDVKKIFQWYNILIETGNLKFDLAEEVNEDLKKELKSDEKKSSTKKVATSPDKVKKTEKKVSKATNVNKSKTTGAAKVTQVKTGVSRGK